MAGVCNIASAESVLPRTDAVSSAALRFWQQTLDTALADAGSCISGLTTAEAERRLVQYGANNTAAPRRRAAWLRVAGRFRNPLIIILLVASVLSAATGDVASFIIVVTIVVRSVVLDFLQEARAQGAVDARQ